MSEQAGDALPIRRRLTTSISDFLARPSNVLALLAFAISAVSFALTEVRRQRDVPFEVIPKAYEKYYEMNRIQLDKWYLAHLFATPDRYPEIAKIIRQNTSALSPEKRAEYLLHERAVADFTFTYYEQILHQWDTTGDTERKFISAIIDYFRSRPNSLLKNPRLVYWWIENGGGLETSYEDATRSDWNRHVLYKTPGEKAQWCDAAGPLNLGVESKVMKPNLPTC